MTLHRPSNVDTPEMLQRIMNTLENISQRIPVIFPVHPRTRQRLVDMNRMPTASSAIQILDPAGYVEFLALQRRATAVITDSGGVQEETTFLGVPCLTLRENTERPVTIRYGTNKLVGHDVELLVSEVELILNGKRSNGTIPPLWDGKASERIARIVAGL